MDPLTPIRSGMLPCLHRFRYMGWVAAFADDGTVTNASIPVTWHGPLTNSAETREGATMCCDRRASERSVPADC